MFCAAIFFNGGERLIVLFACPSCASRLPVSDRNALARPKIAVTQASGTRDKEYGRFRRPRRSGQGCGCPGQAGLPLFTGRTASSAKESCNVNSFTWLHNFNWLFIVIQKNFGGYVKKTPASVAETGSNLPSSILNTRSATSK